MSDITEMKRMLADRARDVAEYLLPRGVLHSREWCVGSISGEPGESLKVSVSGSKAGTWADFAAAGESGDLIDLWCLVRHVPLIESMSQIRDWLGIKSPSFHKSEKTYRRPSKPRCTVPKSAVLEYLTEERKLSLDAIRAYRVGEDGRTIIFPSLLPEDHALAFVKYLNIDRPDGKKVTRVEPGCEPVLFGWQAIDLNAREVVLTEGECLPGSTEVLTPDGWVQLENYRQGTIAQWRDGILEWVHPLARIEREHDGDMIRFSGRFVTMTVTPGHRMPGIDRRGRTRVVVAEKRAAGINRHHRLPRSGVLAGKGIALSDDQIAFCLAISADAAIDIRKQSYAGGAARRLAVEDRYARVGLWKTRKIERFEGLVGRLGLPHRCTDGILSSAGKTGKFFGVPLPEWVPGRLLPWSWIAEATEEQRETIIAEIRHWDGNGVPNRHQDEFSTKHLELAEWVQALCHTSGRCSTIIRRQNILGEWFKISILHGKESGSYQSFKVTRERGEAMVYCLGVPSGMFLAREAGKVFVTGNCDAMSAWDYRYPALSVPFGGGAGAKQRWIEAEFDRMARFEVIYLALDMDREGDLAAAEIADRLGSHRCRRVKLPRKDFNQCKKDGLSYIDIMRCMHEAEALDPPELVQPSEFTDAVIQLFWPVEGRRPGYQLPFHKISDKLFFRPGELTEWTGATGTGKSQLLSHTMLGMAADGAKICAASLEMSAAQVIRRLIKQAGNTERPTELYAREVIHWLDQWLWMFGVVGKSKIERIITVFEYARCRYGCDVFVIDSLMRLGVSSEDYEGQEKAIFEIVNWAVEKNVHVHLVAHARKGDRSTGATVPDADDIKGPSEIGNNAANIIGIWRNRKQEDKIRELDEAARRGDEAAKLSLDELREKPMVLVNVAKQRNGDWEGKFGLWFSTETYQYRGAYDRKEGRCFVEMGPVPMSGSAD